MIKFNKTPVVGTEVKHIEDAISHGHLCGDGPYSKKCQAWFESNFGTSKCLLTPSCTAALEMAAILLDIKEGDEVIMPSYTFVSTANPFVLRGAKIVFVDVRPDTMNIDEKLIEAAITEKTKVIVPVHYAGVACEMDEIMSIAEKHSLFVVEDAAQGVMSTYKGKALGTIGHLGAFSFHETKNYTSGGEGGLLLINDSEFSTRAEIIREKGTNRSLFYRGMVDKYSWVDVGSSFLPSELQSAYLYAQLLSASEINSKRLDLWDEYYRSFKFLADSKQIELPFIPSDCLHNGHMFYIKLKDLDERSAFIDHLKANDVISAFHYVPLHSSVAGRTNGYFFGMDNNTTRDSERLVRLPLYYNMEQEEIAKVINVVLSYFN